MNWIDIAISTIKIKLRDRKALVTTMLLPIVLILILGSALKSTDAFSIKDFGKTTVYYLNDDKNLAGKNFDEFLKEKDIKDILDVKSVNSYSEGEKLVDEGKGIALIYINKDYSNNIENDKKAKIQLYESKYNSVRNSIVENIVDSYNSGANTIIAASKITGKNEGYETSNNVKDKYIDIAGKTPRAIDYYAVTMLVMTLMYGTMYGCTDLDELYFKKVGQRIKTTSINTFEHLFGVVVGEVFFLLIQAIILMLFTKYVYGANWGNNLVTIVLAMLGLATMATGIGIMFGAITNDAERGASLLKIVVPIFTFISGGYYKIITVDSKILDYIPNNLAQTALFNTVYGGSSAAAQNAILTMFVMAAIALIVASLAGRRKAA